MNESVNNGAPVLVCSQPPVISQNIVSLQTEISETVRAVRCTPKTRDGLAFVKEQRAKLRKTFEVLERQRMAVKKAVMEPYDKANAAYKEMLADPIMQADAECKAFIDGVQNTIKQKCTEELKEYWDELVTARGIPWLTFDRCPVKVDMAIASKKDCKKEREQIAAFVDSVQANLETISSLEDAPVVLAFYTQSLDLPQAMWKAQDQKRRIQAAEKQNAENIRRSQERQKSVSEMARENPDFAEAIKKPQEVLVRVSFQATATRPLIRGLIAFMENNYIHYEEVTK